MSRLLNPGLGDYADRLSILELKIADAGIKGREDTHFQQERKAILRLTDPQLPLQDPRFVELRQVNLEIWTLTDAVEDLMKQWPQLNEVSTYDLANYAVQLHTLNKARAELVRLISGPETPKEKL